MKMNFALAVMIVLVVVVLSACTHTEEAVVEKDRVVRSAVPVDAPCKLEADPAEPASLLERYSDEEWAALDLKQRAYALGNNAVQARLWGKASEANAKACK